MVYKLNAKIVLTLAVLITVLIFSAGCNNNTGTTTQATSTSASTTTTAGGTTTISGNGLAVLQHYKTLAVSFHAVITFSVGSSNASYPTELAVPPVPITWNGLTFSGTLEETGPGEDITDIVTGAAANDGKSLTSLVYSRRIIRTTGTGSYFSLTMHDIPLNVGTISGIFAYSGTAIQGFTTGTVYTDGPVTAGQITASTSYVSTDWSNTQQPSLTLTFGQ